MRALRSYRGIDEGVASLGPSLPSEDDYLGVEDMQGYVEPALKELATILVDGYSVFRPDPVALLTAGHPLGEMLGELMRWAYLHGYAAGHAYAEEQAGQAKTWAPPSVRPVPGAMPGTYEVPLGGFQGTPQWPAEPEPAPGARQDKYESIPLNPETLRPVASEQAPGWASFIAGRGKPPEPVRLVSSPDAAEPAEEAQHDRR